MTGASAIAFLEAQTGNAYRPEEYPALRRQRQRWREERPLAGLKVLDATPLYRNTLLKHLNLLAAGADLTVSAPLSQPADRALAAELKRAGFRVLDAVPGNEPFDLVLDCAGCHAKVPSRYGYVELTRSGGYCYERCPQPVFFADGGRIKLLETMLGTGDGMFRAMRQLGYDDWQGKKVLLAGCGKVGRGILLGLLRRGARVTAADRDPAAAPPGVEAFIPFGDAAALKRALGTVDCVITVTGQRDIFAGILTPAELTALPALFVNVGIEDEFGPGVPAERVLNGKLPVNFLLKEPTRLRYIETTMALDNAGAAALVQNPAQWHAGLNLPPENMENELLTITRENGLIADEMEALWKMCGFR